MKMKEMRLGDVVPGAPPPPLGSANVVIYVIVSRIPSGDGTHLKCAQNAQLGYQTLPRKSTQKILKKNVISQFRIRLPGVKINVSMATIIGKKLDE